MTSPAALPNDLFIGEAQAIHHHSHPCSEEVAVVPILLVHHVPALQMVDELSVGQAAPNILPQQAVFILLSSKDF